LQTLRVTDQLAQKVEGQLTKGQRDLLLRRRLKAIKDELGDADGNGDEDDDIVILEKRLEAANLPSHAQASKRLLVTYWRLDERVWTWALPKFQFGFNFWSMSKKIYRPLSSVMATYFLWITI
jgi:hypothetical protein